MLLAPVRTDVAPSVPGGTSAWVIVVIVAAVMAVAVVVISLLVRSRRKRASRS